MALAPIKTFKAIAARGIDPAGLVRLASRVISLEGRSFAGFALQKRFPDLTGRQRFSILNVAARAVKAGRLAGVVKQLTPANVPVDPFLFGDEPAGFRTEVVVRLAVPTIPLAGQKIRTEQRTFVLGFAGIPSQEEIQAAARAELATAAAAAKKRYEKLDLKAVTSDDILVMSVVRRY